MPHRVICVLFADLHRRTHVPVNQNPHRCILFHFKLASDYYVKPFNEEGMPMKLTRYEKLIRSPDLQFWAGEDDS